MSNRNGIDIETAMSILSNRGSSDAHSRTNVVSSSEDDPCITTTKQGNISEHIKTPHTNACNCSYTPIHDNLTSSTTCEPCENSSSSNNNSSESQSIFFYQHCCKMTLLEKLSLLFQLQRERVQTYTLYDTGLQMILSHGQGHHPTVDEYTALCTNVTATFTVLSNSINTICSIMIETSKNQEEKINDRMTMNEIIPWIQKLQQLEKQKLQFTAALHLEKIRLYYTRSIDESSSEEDITNSTTKQTVLFHQSIKQLNISITNVIQQINEVMDEMQSIMLDLS